MDRSGDNRRRARLVVGPIVLVPVVVAGLLGLLVGSFPLGLLTGLVAGLVIGLVVAVLLVRSATDRVLADLGARTSNPGEQPRLHNLLEGLCLTSGVPLPSVALLDTDEAEAYVVGTGPDQATVVISVGLLDRLGRVELEGLLAHALVRIRHRDTVPATLAAALGPLSGPASRAVRSPESFTAADLDACQLTRYPPGLIGALEAVGPADTAATGERTVELTSQRVSRQAHLAIAPIGDDPTTHPPLHERIALLREL